MISAGSAKSHPLQALMLPQPCGIQTRRSRSVAASGRGAPVSVSGGTRYPSVVLMSRPQFVGVLALDLGEEVLGGGLLSQEQLGLGVPRGGNAVGRVLHELGLAVGGHQVSEGLLDVGRDAGRGLG